MHTDLRTTPADDAGATTTNAPHHGETAAAGGTPPLRILLAVTNDDAETAALSVAHALATRRHAQVTALSAFDPARYGVPGTAATVLGFADAILGSGFREEREIRLHEHIAAHFGAPQPWATDVELGDAASCIARGARTHDSTLVVLGLHHHGAVARALGDDTARAVMRRVAVPILGVRPTLTTLPTRITVGVDFSDASTRVARTALELLDENGALELVYVRPSIPLGATEETQGLARIVIGGIDAAFTQLIDALHVPPSVRVTRIVREGNPADELLRHAEATQPDLIAVGPQRHSRLSRLLLGSVTSAVLDDGRWSVLVTPPSRDADEESDR